MARLRSRLSALAIALGGLCGPLPAQAQPANDACADATEITSVPFVDTVDTTTATLEPGDPIVPESCEIGGLTRPAQFGVWYRYTATAPVNLLVDTRGSDYDTIITGWVGTCGALSLRFCDSYDDDLALPFNLFATGRMMVSLGAGEEILILISDENDFSGGTLQVSVTTSPVFQTSFVEMDGAVPSVAANTVGEFLVVFSGVDLGRQIHARRYSATGAVLGPPFVVADTNAYEPAVTRSGSGFVVAWDDGAEVAAQRLDASGTLVGTPIAVDSEGIGYMDVAGNATGGFVVAWDGAGDLINARSFDATDTPVGPSVAVSTAIGRDPQVAMASDGTFVVVWTDQTDADGDDYGVFGRRVDATGTPLGTPFQVNTYTTGSQGIAGPAISMDAAGNFVVVWSDYTERYGVYCNVMGRRFDATGTPLGGEFRVNTNIFGTGYYGEIFGDDVSSYPTVASGAAGDFVVVWNRSYAGPYARVFDSAGSPQGAEFQVSHRIDEYQYYVDVGMNAAGAFLVAWNHEVTNGNDNVLGRHFAVAPPPSFCAAVALSDCHEPTLALEGQLTVKDGTPDARDSLVWKWVKGDAVGMGELGNPLANGTYALCIYDGSGELVSASTVDAGGTCGVDNPKPCWKAFGLPPGAKGYKYVNKDANAAGVQKLILKPGDAGKSKVIVKAKGGALATPSLPPSLPLTVQLQGTNATCWSAVFDAAGVLDNTSAVFSGRPN